jgi:Fe-S-cluster containining protein
MPGESSNVEFRTHCIRCGACCLRSSPTLQVEDLHLIEEGRIEKKNLITLRRGELVTDIVKGTVVPSAEELIKVREKTGTKQGCLFYDETERECSIYDFRPLQCRALKCWDNREIVEVLGRPKMNRSNVVRNGVLFRLIDEHEKRCGCGALEEHVRRIPSEGDKAVEGLLDLLKFDFHLRPFLSQKLDIPLDEMDFYFGRPLVDRITIYGLTVIREQDGSFFLTGVSEKGKNGMLE